MTRGAIIDDTQGNIVYFGNWNSNSQPLNFASPEYNSTSHSTNDTNASAVITVQGASYIKAFGTLDQPASKGLPSSIWTLDNGEPLHVDGAKGLDLSNRTDIISHVEIYSSGAFTVGTHTLVVNVTGVSPNGPTFYLDFIVAQTANTLDVEYAILNNLDTSWVYPGWTNGTSSSAYEQDVSLPPEDGGAAILHFHGTEIAIMGNLDTTASGDTAIALVRIDNGIYQTIHVSDVSTISPTATATGTTPTSPPLYQNVEIFKTTGLSDRSTRQHSITISASPHVASVWALDYAIYGPVYANDSSSSTATASSGSSSSSPSPNSHSSSKAAIVGGVVGGVVGLLAIIGTIWFLYRRSKRRYEEDNTDILPDVFNIPIDSPIRPFSKGAAAMTLDRPYNRRESSSRSNIEDRRHTQPYQEQDGGIRLAYGDDPPPSTLPPVYERH